MPGEIIWNLEVRLKQFPSDLASICDANYLFSPNLMLYLDFDKDDNRYVIKHTLNQTIFKIIP